VRGSVTVAVCDILGFSRLVERQPLAAVVDNAIGWFRKALNHSLLKSGFPSDVPPHTELEDHPHVGVAWFSDTILLYTKHDTDEAVRELLGTVAWLLFETMLNGMTKIRGGIAYGDAHIDPQNSLYVGVPIIEAYKLEQSQQWSGASLAPSAVARLPEFARTGPVFRLVGKALGRATEGRPTPQYSGRELERWNPPPALAPSLVRAFR
jgi:hypothetical protein